ncbi:MAG: trigger factor [Rubricoccaceae bacterium]|nr:trigger factor [Rubricoccaceae bacterium]
MAQTMETKVTALNDVDYRLDISVPSEEIEPRILAILKERRKGINLKGFRPGKVPISHVRKMVGSQVAVQVTEEIIGETFREKVSENDEYDVMGQPRLSDIDYNFAKGGDLTAEVKFAVRPQFEVADITGQQVTKYVREFTEEDIEAEIERRREAAATLEDAAEGAVATEKDVVTISIQPISEEGEPIGPKQNDAKIVVADPQLRTELKEALIGSSVGDSKRVDFPHLHEEDEGHDHEDHVDRYMIEITAIEHRILPEVDAAFIKSQTNDEFEELDDLKARIREQLENSWEQRSRQALEGNMVEKLAEAHEFTLPETVVEAALDAMLDDIARRSDNKLPDGFDVADFREKQREQAERQVRWLLVKDKFVEAEGIEVTEADFDAEFDKIASDDVSVDVVKQYFAENGLINQMGDNLLNQRIFAILEDRFEIVEKTREDLEREREEREAAEAKANRKGLLSRLWKKD